MRAKEFIIEYIQYNPAQFMARWKSENQPYKDQIGSDGSGFTKWVEQYDPTQDKKFVNWMIIRYLKGDIKRLEDIPGRISSALDTYWRLSRTNKLKPEHKDINRITDLEDVVDSYQEKELPSRSEKSSSEEQAIYDNGDAKLIFNDAEYKIVIPITHTGSCYFGKNTKWCTASAKDRSIHNKYSKQGPLYVILQKATNTRWQFHFESEQFMDKKDDDINIIPFFKSHPKIFAIFKKLGLVEYDGKSWKIGTNYYNNDGQLHREDGPAVVKATGDKEWYINGKRHREDGPAVEYVSGDKVWYINGNRHREDGPAIEYATGYKEWYLHGKRHREDGPAIEYSYGDKEWYLNGEYITTEPLVFLIKLHKYQLTSIDNAE